MASSMESRMSEDPIISPEACIFRIPSILYRHNEKAYIPNAFSIGPFHHGKENLKETEKIKFKYLQGLIRRTNPATVLMACIDAIKQVENEVRSCYKEEIGMSEDEFVEMLVLDGCFIIELLRKYANEDQRDRGDPIFSMSCMPQYLYQDLILLENQIPWFVLERLYSLTSDPFESKSLVQLALVFFENVFSDEATPVDFNLFANQNIKHILDLLRSSLLLPLPEEQEQELTVWQSFPSARVIEESGIKFKKVKSTTILDVKFVNGTLEMPSILISEFIEPAFRNLISYEQCSPYCSPVVTCYAMLLDNLINTTEDMNILSKTGILNNWLNPEDATQFFKMLYYDTGVKEFYFQKLCVQVNKYREKLWPRWRAFYFHNYFGKPWAIISQIFAILLLTLAILQTIYTMMPGK
ncbi:hypothetical protein SLEP1_g19637 [Rubroshorea leprosula]|uniref:Uncharacterized protein n=1 Tax=Rubroshorea leprosula TaxID=152421 RepID=A0AAV5J5K2_9ROSI|nr:hypothetical protein SLEP1_g19637 [Rubroshorea leprosula]